MRVRLSLLRGERFHSITMADGLPDNIISQIHETPDGRLWIGTNRGIAVLAKEEVVALKQGGAGPFHPLVINRAVCRVQRAIAACLNALALLRVIPSLALGGNSKGPGAPEPS